MNSETITKCEKMAREFLKKVDLVKKRRRWDSHTFFGCKESGALRRCSLDLTRSLAEMRKS